MQSVVGERMITKISVMSDALLSDKTDISPSVSNHCRALRGGDELQAEADLLPFSLFRKPVPHFWDMGNTHRARSHDIDVVHTPHHRVDGFLTLVQRGHR